jgi:hypothetical protein
MSMPYPKTLVNHSFKNDWVVIILVIKLPLPCLKQFF